MNTRQARQIRSGIVSVRDCLRISLDDPDIGTWLLSLCLETGTALQRRTIVRELSRQADEPWWLLK